jgi:hypothetical protein
MISMSDISRRWFLGAVPAAAAVMMNDPAVAWRAQDRGQPSISSSFPQQDPVLARDVVGASHGNVARVKELVTARPALARAVWDWGYGDWETALGAASHVGHREIAQMLLAAGAHPTIFSAAMLGQLEVVKAFVTASPGIQRTRGPHGITLLDHARFGKSAEVVSYLESLGDASPAYPNEPFLEGDPDALLGTYVFGPGPADRLIVARNKRGVLTIARDGAPERNLSHHGRRLFNPAGAEAVAIQFEPASGRASGVVVTDGPLIVRAVR